MAAFNTGRGYAVRIHSQLTKREIHNLENSKGRRERKWGKREPRSTKGIHQHWYWLVFPMNPAAAKGLNKLQRIVSGLYHLGKDDGGLFNSSNYGRDGAAEDPWNRGLWETWFDSKLVFRALDTFRWNAGLYLSVLCVQTIENEQNSRNLRTQDHAVPIRCCALSLRIRFELVPSLVSWLIKVFRRKLDHNTHSELGQQNYSDFSHYPREP